MHFTKDGKVDVSSDGADWIDLPGVSRLSITHRDPPVQERRDFDGVHPLVGRPGSSRIEVTVPELVVGHRSYPMLTLARANQTDVYVRVSYPERVMAIPHNNAQVTSINSDTGLVVLSQHGEHVDFESPAVRPGQAIKSDSGVYWAIDRVEGGNVYVITNGMASGTTGYTLVVPPVKTAEVQCRVTSFGEIAGDTNSTLATTAHFVPHETLGALVLGGIA